MKYYTPFVFLSTIFLGMLLLSSSVSAQEEVSDEIGVYTLYQKIEEDGWEFAAAEEFQPEFSTKAFDLSSTTDEINIRIVQQGKPYGGVEQVDLYACFVKMQPLYARYVDGGKNILLDVMFEDKNVVDAHEREVELSWRIPYGCMDKLSLKLTANAYGYGFPLQMPNQGYLLHNRSESINFMYNVDGVIEEVDGKVEADYEYLFTPSSGHPDGITYAYIRENDDHMYVALDVTSDNTDDPDKDWVEFIINDENGKEKTFHVDKNNSSYGVCSFGFTSKVPYKHQSCEFDIPKSDIPTGEFEFKVKYYGTASILYTYQAVRGTDNSLYVRYKNESGGNWVAWKRHGSTLSTPTLQYGYFISTAYVFLSVRGTDNDVYTKYTTDGTTWSNWVKSGKSLDRVEMERGQLGSGNQIYQTVRGTDNGIYTRYTTDGTTWSPWEKSGSMKGSASMEYLVFSEARLYQAIRGTDNGVYVRYSPTVGTWLGWQKLNGKALDISIEEYTAALDTDLYLAIRGTDNAIYTKIDTDGTGWSVWTKSGKTKGKVSMFDTFFSIGVDSNRMYQTVRGMNDSIYMRYTTDGSSWNGWTKLGLKSYSDPETFQEIANQYFYVAVRGNNNSVNTRFFDGTDWTLMQENGKTLSPVDMAVI